MNNYNYWLIVGGMLYAQMALATYQCNSWEAYPQGQAKARELLTTYQAHIEKQQYAKALEIWMSLFEYVQCPEDNPNQIYREGILIYLNLSKNALDTATREAYQKQAKELKIKMAACLGMAEVVPLFNCNCRQVKWAKKYQADTTNWRVHEIIIQELELLCENKSTFYKRVEKAYELHKPFALGAYQSNYEKGKSYWLQAIRFKKQGETTAYNNYEDTAYTYFEIALKEEDSTIKNKEELAYQLAYRYYKKGKFKEARSYCEKAIALNPNWGEPYLLIGTLYVSSANICDAKNNGSGWEAQTLVWVAIDAWTMAKKVDKSKIEEANRLIAKFRAFMPIRAAIFQRGLKEGDRYLVGCWVQRWTMIRASGKSY